jgi:CBS domain-containing protein
MTTGRPPSPPRLRDLPLRPVVAVARGTTVEEAALAMRQNDVGCLVVADVGQRISVVTERDLVSALAAHHRVDLPVEIVAGADPLTMPGDAGVLDAAMAMLATGVRHIVVTHYGQAVGVVSMRDVLTVVVAAVVPERLFLIALRRTSVSG